MQNDPINTELFINRLLDEQIDCDAQHELNLALIRDPEMMQLRDDYQKVDAAAAEVMKPLRKGVPIDLKAIFDAPTERTTRVRSHRGWLMIPGAVAAALLAMIIPHPDLHGTSKPQMGIDWANSYPSSAWGGGSDLIRPVSNAPKVKSQTGRDVIGVVGDDGNLYWIEVERKRTVRWPAGSSLTPRPEDSM